MACLPGEDAAATRVAKRQHRLRALIAGYNSLFFMEDDECVLREIPMFYSHLFGDESNQQGNQQWQA